MTSPAGGTASALPAPTVVIRPSEGWVSLRLGELWSYRELLYFLVWRDVKVRYKQTVLGAAWAILQPVMTMVVFSLFFGNLAKVPSDGVPYPLFSYAALVPWTLFAFGLSQGANSLVGSQNLIKKVYFPRLAIPFSSVVVSFVDFAIAFAILVVLMVWYQYPPGWPVVLLPFFILLACAAAMGAGLWMASLNVKYRDFRYIVPFIVQFGLYVSPVGFSSSVVPEQWRLLYSLNPMVGVIDGFRWAILGNTTIYWPGFILSVGLVLGLLISGLWYFRQTERTFADVI